MASFPSPSPSLRISSTQTQQSSYTQPGLHSPQTIQSQQVTSPRQVVESQYPYGQPQGPPSRELSRQVMQDPQLDQLSSQQQTSYPQHILSSTPSPRPQQTSPPPVYSQSPSSSQIEHPLDQQHLVSGAPNVLRGPIEYQAATESSFSSPPPISEYTPPQSAASYDSASIGSHSTFSGSDSDANRRSSSSNVFHNNDLSNKYQGIKQQPDVQFLNHLWAHEITANPSSKLCTHCRSGIPYHELYFRCLFCQLNICNKCHGSHPPAHYQNLIKIVSKQSTPGAPRSEKECSRCQNHVHCRHDCQECGFTLCDECHSASNDRHTHRSFISFEPPFRTLKISGDASSQHRCSHSTVSNCSRCQGPVDLRHYEYKCKTCLMNYDGSINLCEACYSESWSSHDQSHESIYIKLEPVSNDAESGLGCIECGDRFSSLDRTTLIRHAHKSYIFNIGPRAREVAVNEAFRLCQLKPFRTDQPQVLGCARCRHDFPANTMRICAGACEGTFCEHCFPLASVNHMHGPQNFRSLIDKPRPEIGFLPAGWRAMENKEGRIYYIQDLTNAFTFNKPAVPDALPDGWVKTVDPLGKTMYLHHQTNTSSYVSPVYGVAPPGWELKQTEAGRLFYVNRQTQATSWHKPHSEPLPPGWEAGQHSDGRVYYINHVTKTNTWIKPTLPANASVLSSSSQVMTPSNPPVALHPATTMARPAVGPTRPVSVMVNHPGLVATPFVSGVRSQSTNFTTLPMRTMSLVSNPTSQQMRPIQAQSGPVGVGLRPSLPQQTTSSPAISTQNNTTSSVGSLTNSVVNNPHAMNAAVSLGKFAIKTVVASDFGNNNSIDSGSVDCSAFDFGDSSYYQVQNTSAAPNDITSSGLTNISSNSNSGILITQPRIESSASGPNNLGYIVQNEQMVTSSSASQSQMSVIDSYNCSNPGDTPTITTDLVGDTNTTSYTYNQPWMSDLTGSVIGYGNQDVAAYSSLNLSVAENPGASSSTSSITTSYQDMNAGQIQGENESFIITSDSSTNMPSIQDYNTYQVQAQESDISFTAGSTTSQDFSNYDVINTGVVDETFATTTDDSSIVVDSSFDCDFTTSDAGLF